MMSGSISISNRVHDGRVFDSNILLNRNRYGSTVASDVVDGAVE
jgi:hypothetical protein